MNPNEIKQSLTEIWHVYNHTGRLNNDCYRVAPQDAAMMKMTEICTELVDTVAKQAKAIEKLTRKKAPRPKPAKRAR